MTRLAVLALLFGVLAPGVAEATGRGDSGAEVTEVQTILHDLGYTVKVDGIFGPQTEKAVKSWQRSNGLVVDGIVGNQTLASLRHAAEAQTPAVRVGNAHTVGGLDGRPFAPAGLSGCDEMNFYRLQWGLPDAFDGIGYRESRCRNDVVSSIGCCFGYWQNYISSHLSRWSAYRQPIIDRCQVTGVADIYGNDPLQKQKQACVTAVVYSISGFSPWSTA